MTKCSHFLGAGQWCPNGLPCPIHPVTARAAACEQTGQELPASVRADIRGHAAKTLALAKMPVTPYATTRRDLYALAFGPAVIARLHTAVPSLIGDEIARVVNATIAALDEVKS